MVKMHLTLAIHLLHWPSSPIHTRQNILFKLRCTSVPILPYAGQVVAWTYCSSCTALQTKMPTLLLCQVAKWWPPHFHRGNFYNRTKLDRWPTTMHLESQLRKKKIDNLIALTSMILTRIWTRSQTEISSDPYCSLRRASKSKGISRNAESMFPIGFLQVPCEMWIYSVNSEVTISTQRRKMLDGQNILYKFVALIFHTSSVYIKEGNDWMSNILWWQRQASNWEDSW